MEISSGEFQINVDSGKIEVNVLGSGKPLIFTPVPWGISFIKWEIFSELAKNFTLIFINPRGVGKSTGINTKKDFSIDTLVSDITKVQEFFKIEKANIFGSSAGGFTAMKYAIKNPKLVSKLIVVCSSPTGHFHKGTIRDKNHPRFFEIENEFKIFRENFNSENFRNYMLKVYQMDIQKENDKSEIINKFNDVDISIDRYKYFATVELNNYDIKNELKNVNIETLVIGAKFDLHVSVSHSEKISELIQNSKLEIFEQSGHFPFIDEKEKFLKVVTDFLN